MYEIQLLNITSSPNPTLHRNHLHILMYIYSEEKETMKTKNHRTVVSDFFGREWVFINYN